MESVKSCMKSVNWVDTDNDDRKPCWLGKKKLIESRWVRIFLAIICSKSLQQEEVIAIGLKLRGWESEPDLWIGIILLIFQSLGRLEVFSETLNIMRR